MQILEKDESQAFVHMHFHLCEVLPSSILYVRYMETMKSKIVCTWNDLLESELHDHYILFFYFFRFVSQIWVSHQNK